MESNNKNKVELPPIPGKRYFTIGEVSDLCAVKPHVLRYWEQEFPQLKPVKRRGNRRYYQQHDVQMVRTIRSLLYEQGFTINGAKQQLSRRDSKKSKAVEAETTAATSPVSGSQDLVKALRTELEDLLENLAD
ncbi:MAG: MerR family transcriptional regulator [Gammaproteobacteria bacterium]|nr:MerR family transcriptional regulator [Gammaproteobacteria bacterium]